MSRGPHFFSQGLFQLSSTRDRKGLAAGLTRLQLAWSISDQNLMRSPSCCPSALHCLWRADLITGVVSEDRSTTFPSITPSLGRQNQVNLRHRQEAEGTTDMQVPRPALAVTEGKVTQTMGRMYVPLNKTHRVLIAAQAPLSHCLLSLCPSCTLK